MNNFVCSRAFSRFLNLCGVFRKYPLPFREANDYFPVTQYSSMLQSKNWLKLHKGAVENILTVIQRQS